MQTCLQFLTNIKATYSDAMTILKYWEYWEKKETNENYSIPGHLKTKALTNFQMDNEERKMEEGISGI